MGAKHLATLFSGAIVSQAYNVQYEDVTVGGFVCKNVFHKDAQGARVYYPQASGKFPLVSFAHGFNNPGNKSFECYAEMNSDLAAAGYVVIVSMSSEFPSECADQWKDQIHSIDWAKTSDLADRIDFSQVGLLGHSMGGGSTYHAAGMADVVSAQNIGAAVALHPQITSPAPLQPITNPQVPIFFGTGSKDGTVSPKSVKNAYSQATGIAKAFSEIDGATHFEPQTNCEGWTGAGQRRHTPFAIAMFDCHLKGDKNQCAKVYGSGADSLCSGSVKMTDCEHENEPSFEDVVV